MAQERAELRRHVAAHSTQDSKRQTLEGRIQTLKDEVESERKRANNYGMKLQQMKDDTDDAFRKWQDSQEDWMSTNRRLQESIDVLESERNTATSELARTKAQLERDRLLAHKQTCEIVNLGSTVKDISSCWENSKAEVLSKSNENTMLKGECERLRSRNELLVSQTDELAKSKKHLDEQVSSLERHLEERNASLNGARTEISEFRLQLTEVTDQLDYTKQQYALFKAETDNLKSQLAVAIAEASEQADAHSRNVKDLSSTENFLRRDIVRFQEKIKELEDFRTSSISLAEQNAILHNNLRDLDENFNAMSLKADELALHNSELTGEKSALQAQLTESTNVVRRQVQEIEDLLSQRNQADEARRVLADNIKQLTETCAALRLDLRVQQEAVTFKESEIEKLTEALSETATMSQQQHSQAQTDSAALHHELGTLRQTLHDAQVDYLDKESQWSCTAARLETSLVTLQNEMAIATSTLAAKDSQITQLEEQLQAKSLQLSNAVLESETLLSKRAEEFEGALREKTHEIECLLRTVAALEASLDQVNSAHDKAIVRLREELNLKFNKERDAVVVLRQKVASEECKLAALKEGISSSAAQLEVKDRSIHELSAQVDEKTKLLSMMQARKDEYKAKVSRVDAAFAAQREEFRSLLADYKSISQEHNNMVTAANRQYRRLRDGLKAAQVKLSEILQTSDEAVVKHLSTLRVHDFATELAGIAFETKSSLDPSIAAQRPISEAPLNSHIAPQKRARVEQMSLDAIQ